ncbi:uncharacterized protein LOC143038232 [Oratosquilla oratoria]|uniref:uncharacterized protein LOC143038232 n=1 Tax=Oratosquilla oratoria TaxID=337810 RepID=UPI003F766E3C
MGEAGDLNNNFHSADILEDKEDLTFSPSTRSQVFKHQRTQQEEQQQHCRLVHHQHLLQVEEQSPSSSSSSSGHASVAMLDKGEESAKIYANMLEKGGDSAKTYALRPRNGSRRGLCYRDAVELDWSPASPPPEEEEEEERTTPTKNLRMSKSGYGRTTPLSKYRRKTANAKERQRMRQINVAFEALRRSLSRGAEASVHRQQQQPRGLTKISTLRLAISYIQALSAILGKDTSSAPEGSFIESSICKDEDISSYDSNSESLQFFVTSSFDLKSESFSSYQLNGSDFESAADGAKNNRGGDGVVEGVPHVGQAQFGKDAAGQGTSESATHIMNSSPSTPFPMATPTSCRASVVASYDQNSSTTSENHASKLNTYNISNGVPTTNTNTVNNTNNNNNVNNNTGNTATSATTNTNNNDNDSNNNNNNNNSLGTRKSSATFYALDDFNMYDPLAVLDALPEYPMPAVV